MGSVGFRPEAVVHTPSAGPSREAASGCHLDVPDGKG